MIEIVLASIAVIPSTTTVIVGALQNRSNKRATSRQSIELWIMHDQLNWLVKKQLPRHYERIIAEFESYHNKGGNGVVEAEVEEYKDWVEELTHDIKSKKGGK